MTHTVYLSLGSNLGNKEENLQCAMKRINEQIGKIVSQSAHYVTTPWGFDSSHTFLNNALSVVTSLEPMELLDATQQIERDLGRLKKSAGGVYFDRLIDIDILLYDERVMNHPRLILPHPLLHKRLFVLQPLSEIAPELAHPLLGESIQVLYKKLLADETSGMQ